MSTYAAPTTQDEQLNQLTTLGNAVIGRFDKIETLHANCTNCWNEAESAATMASVSGSTGCTHGTTEVWRVGEPIEKPFAHVARVTDTKADRARKVREFVERQRKAPDINRDDPYDKGYLAGMRDLLTYVEGLS